MNKKTNLKNDAKKKPANTEAGNKLSGDPQKKDGKPVGDPTYNALHQKNDRSRSGRHEGESEMNDENRSGGDRQ